MRLISQDGMIDVPYEQVSVELRDCDIWCGYYPTLSQHLISKKFAIYSNIDKALKVMKMLREEYLQYCTARSSEYWFAFNNPKVFQFPKDEEVEV